MSALERFLEDLHRSKRDPNDPALPRIRTEPEDFAVEEVPLEEPGQEGTHLYLWIEKRLLNSDEIALRLARLAGVPAREVGFAGRKDRRAVCRQWFSAPRLDLERAKELEGEDLRVLRVARGERRLRTGMLRANRFVLAVRNVDEEKARKARERLEELRSTGLPNRFGRQRFGSGGRNLHLGMALLRGERIRGNQRTRSFVVAAVQAAVFNEILARRPAAVNELLPGDLVWMHDRECLELIEDTEAMAGPLERFEVSPTGPLFGFKVREPGPRVADFEHDVLEDFGLGDLYGLRLPWGVRLFGGRRPLRARVEDVETRFEPETGTLHLSFALPSGSYATVLLSELFPDGFSEGR